MRSIPSVGHVMMLMGVIVYIYAIVGYHLFHEHDPDNWRTLGVSVLTLFNIITLEGWTEVMRKAMELNPLAWIYFVSFVVIGTFVAINMFVAVIINNLDEAKAERSAGFGGPTIPGRVAAGDTVGPGRAAPAGGTAGQRRQAANRGRGLTAVELAGADILTGDHLKIQSAALNAGYIPLCKGGEQKL